MNAVKGIELNLKNNWINQSWFLNGYNDLIKYRAFPAFSHGFSASQEKLEIRSSKQLTQISLTFEYQNIYFCIKVESFWANTADINKITKMLIERMCAVWILQLVQIALYMHMKHDTNKYYVYNNSHYALTIFIFIFFFSFSLFCYNCVLCIYMLYV